MKAFKVVLLVVFVVGMSLAVSAQAELKREVASKTYDDGTRITYLDIHGVDCFNEDLITYVYNTLLSTGNISRVFYPKKQNNYTWMYDAKEDVTPEMFVDAINDAIEEYNISLKTNEELKNDQLKSKKKKK